MTLSSTYHNIKLQLIGIDEPNNGRILHVAEIYVNGYNETEKYFADWNRLNEKLDKVTIDSPDGKYVYIPAESGGFLIETTSLEKVALPYKRLSTISFIGNFFYKSILVTVYSDEIALFNTVTGISNSINFPANSINWAVFNTSDELIINYKSVAGLLNKKFDFTNLTLI